MGNFGVFSNLDPLKTTTADSPKAAGLEATFLRRSMGEEEVFSVVLLRAYGFELQPAAGLLGPAV
jgi:hypothetical protein